MRKFWVTVAAAALLAVSAQSGLAKDKRDKHDRYRSNNEDVMSEFWCTGMTNSTARCSTMPNKRFKRENGEPVHVSGQRTCKIVFYPFFGAVRSC
ncbi:MAG: hypothetical protein HY245_13095 [Rhizobiales bacterium]|nr:hypothetical protein [Hyphomicrobiales bacterium]MBI3674326.1 hypothetical protein [Hyphomicrobiales bacterium]